MFHRTVDFTLLFALNHCLSFVVLLLPPTYPYFDFDPSLLEIEGEREQRQPLQGNRTTESDDLPLVHQQLPVPSLFMIEDIAKGIGCNTGVDQPEFVSEDFDIPLLNIAPMITQRFDLSAEQLYARLKGLQDLIVVVSLSIAR